MILLPLGNERLKTLKAKLERELNYMNKVLDQATEKERKELMQTWYSQKVEREKALKNINRKLNGEF